MRCFAIALVLSATALAAAAESKPPALEKVTVAQLQQAVAAAPGKSDAELAQQLSSLELTERLSSGRLAQWNGSLPGDKSRQALLLLADKSVFLNPPADESPADPKPDPAATRQMLVKLVNYVNTTLRQLPNLLASLETTGFEDRPQEDALEATGTVSYSYLPLHVVGKSLASVTFRDRKEVVDENAGKAGKQGPRISGLATSGEFGPILSTVLGDALKGKITWARWEQGPTTRWAIFHYEVPEDKSNYRVKFCCVVNGFNADGQADLQPFDERSSYKGEIAFDAADGSIYRMTLEAALPGRELVSNAGMVVEYAPVDIGGKNYICPVRSVSVLGAHVYQPHGMYAKTNFQGPSKTFLNDVVFSNYRRFGSESRILTGDNGGL
ncbi:MAG: hypothetical protein WBV28_14135 [Terracidiphilus sp.]